MRYDRKAIGHEQVINAGYKQEDRIQHPGRDKEEDAKRDERGRDTKESDDSSE